MGDEIVRLEDDGRLSHAEHGAGFVAQHFVDLVGAGGAVPDGAAPPAGAVAHSTSAVAAAARSALLRTHSAPHLCRWLPICCECFPS